MSESNKDADKATRSMDRIASNSPFFEALTELLPVCLFAKDLEGRYVYVNNAFVATTTQPDMESIIGKKPSDVLAPEHAALAEEEDRKILETGEAILNRENLNYRWHQKDNYVIVSKICVRDADGKKLGIAGISLDITKRKLDEQRLAELNRELESRNQRYEEELSLGRQVQKVFVRVEQPLPGCPLDIGYHYQPSEKLSGDLMVAEPIDEHRWAILICDVMGHGIRSALVTGILRGFYDQHKADNGDPGDFVTKLNQHYISVLKGLNSILFTTLNFGILDLRTGQFSIACAGHHEPLWFRASEEQFVSESEPILVSNPALGLLDDFVFEHTTIQLKEGDSMMFYTDGLTESCCPDGEEFGVAPIRALMHRLYRENNQKIVDEVVRDMEAFAGHINDDISLMMLTYDPSA